MKKNEAVLIMEKWINVHKIILGLHLSGCTLFISLGMHKVDGSALIGQQIRTTPSDWLTHTKAI